MDTILLPAFGTLLRRHRIAASLTQDELAERVYSSRRSISDMERGVPHRPRKETVDLLAQALELSPSDRAVFVEAAARLRAPSSASASAIVESTASTPMPRSAPPFVGRARELAVLDRHLAGEGPPVLLLVGEPGIGKSRLLHAAVPRAVGSGWSVLEGGCQRRGGHAPYTPLLGALQHAMRGQPMEHLRTTLQGCAWLVRLLPELADGPLALPAVGALPPPQERRLMVEAVARFLANVAGPAGTLLVLDDLQWADPDALDLLATLARTASDIPLRIIGAYRDTEVQTQDPLAIAVADLSHAGLATRRLLHPLAPAETAQLLDTLLEASDETGTVVRDAVLRRSGGVPFFVVSCLQWLRLDERIDRSAPPAPDRTAMPWDVAQSVRQRVDTLPEAVRVVLSAAAVIGRVVPPRLVTVVAGLPEDDVLAALDTACRVRLLVEADQAYQFAHDVIREVIEADVGVARRLVLHRRVAEALEQGPGALPVEALAYHYGRSGDQERAALYLDQAGDRATAQAAPSAARTYYEDAVTRLESLRALAQAAGVREKLGQTLRAAIHYDAALAVLTVARDQYRVANDLEGSGRVTALMGQIHGEMGTPQQGIDLIRPALESLEARGPSLSLLLLYEALAELNYFTGRSAERLAMTDRAVAILPAIEDEQRAGLIARHRGSALYGVGRATEALTVCEEAIRLTEATGDLAGLTQALEVNAHLHTSRGDLHLSGRQFHAAIAAATRLGDTALLLQLTTSSARVMFLLGNWAAARQEAARARAAASESVAGGVWLSRYMRVTWAEFDLAEGLWDEASRALRDNAVLCQESSDLMVFQNTIHLLAELDILEGRPDSACARLAPLLAPHREEDFGTAKLAPILAWAHLETGDVARAAVIAAQAVARLRPENLRLLLVDALRVQGMVDARQAHWPAATEAFEEALALARAMSYPRAEARTGHTYGLMHIHMGELALARERLEAALAIFQYLGARKDIERLEQDMAAIR